MKPISNEQIRKLFDLNKFGSAKSKKIAQLQRMNRVSSASLVWADEAERTTTAPREQRQRQQFCLGKNIS